jgi:hypothetical protein
VLLGNPPQLLVTTVFYVGAIVIFPFVAVAMATAVSRAAGPSADGWLAVATRYTFTLIPLGFAMWLAHYSFHLLTSYDTVIPATQRFVADLGWNALGAPFWQYACCRPAGDWVAHFEIVVLDLGLLLSLYTGFRIAETNTAHLGQALKVFLPWGLLTLLLFVCGVWIVFQPMEMRGTLPLAG